LQDGRGLCDDVMDVILTLAPDMRLTRPDSLFRRAARYDGEFHEQ
jgi:hypothetical protein